VGKNRKKHGEEYWRSTKFPDTLDYQEQIKLLNDEGIPIYAFYVAPYAKESFESIGSSSTNGKSAYLNVNSPTGADLLVDLVTTSILQKVAEKNNLGVDLVASYNQLFSKSYA